MALFVNIISLVFVFTHRATCGVEVEAFLSSFPWCQVESLAHKHITDESWVPAATLYVLNLDQDTQLRIAPRPIA